MDPNSSETPLVSVNALNASQVFTLAKFFKNSVNVIIFVLPFGDVNSYLGFVKTVFSQYPFPIYVDKGAATRAFKLTSVSNENA